MLVSLPMELASILGELDLYKKLLELAGQMWCSTSVCPGQGGFHKSALFS